MNCLMSLSLKLFINRDLKRDISLIFKLLQTICALISSINVYLMTSVLIKNLNIFERCFKERIELTSSETLVKKSS